jgi:hypothetical protein
MHQGDKSSYADKQKRQARHIEEGDEKRAAACLQQPDPKKMTRCARGAGLNAG